MKKRILLTVLCTVCLLCSCGETRMTGDVSDTGNINTADIIGSTEEIPYEDIIKKEMFAMCFDNYTTGSDPLQLVGGTFSDAAVAKPLKPVLVEGSSVKAVLNVWEFPVVHDGDYIGFINCDMRNLRNGEPSFFGGESFSPKLNEALKKGDIALFDTANGTYGIYDFFVYNITVTGIGYALVRLVQQSV